MNNVWYAYLGWIAAAGLLGFTISAFFAGVLHLRRNFYLFPYITLTCLFSYAYARWSGHSISSLVQHNWMWGLIGAIILALWLIKNILSQPASPRSKGVSLALDILWSGIMYGFMDALLLSILPVLATWQAFTLLGWTVSWIGKILVGVTATLASFLVTAAYHLGYHEYRGKDLLGPVIGNTIMTLGYLVTNNPLAAVLSHIAMHIAGVLHGPASVMQLPPHYQEAIFKYTNPASISDQI